MLTPEERFWIGIEVLERMRPKLRARRLSAQDGTPAPDWEFSSSQEEMAGVKVPQNTPMSQADSPSSTPPCLQSVIEETGSFSPQTVVLGLCDDRIPFTLDLNNPAPGALLMLGDMGSGKTNLLRSILESTVCLNRPGEVVFQIVAQNLEDYSRLAGEPHCSIALSPTDPAARSLVANLAGIVEQRRRGNLRGPSILLAVDDLAEWAQYMEDDEFASLLTILKHGPRLRIWTLATLATERAGEVNEILITAFRTRILGAIQDLETSEYLAGDPASRAEELMPGVEFTTAFGDEWIRFSILAAD